EGAEVESDEASAKAAGEPEVGELLRREAGFWRIDNDDNIELLIAHSDGMIELMYGKPLTERAWQLESASTLATETGPTALGPGKRLYGLMPNNDLGWVDERLIDGEMVPWMSAQLKRVRGSLCTWLSLRGDGFRDRGLDLARYARPRHGPAINGRDARLDPHRAHHPHARCGAQALIDALRFSHRPAALRSEQEHSSLRRAREDPGVRAGG